MKILLKIFFSIIFVFSAVQVFAQDAVETTTVQKDNTNKYFDLVLTRDEQSPLDKSITYTIAITPHMASPKTQILWNAPSSVKINPRHKEFVSLVADKTYSYKVNIKPSKAGTIDLSVNVISWQYDTNYTNSANNTLQIDSNLLVVPLDPGYQVGVIAKVLIIIFLSGGAIWGGIIIAKRVSKKAKVWFTPPY